MNNINARQLFKRVITTNPSFYNEVHQLDISTFPAYYFELGESFQKLTLLVPWYCQNPFKVYKDYQIITNSSNPNFPIVLDKTHYIQFFYKEESEFLEKYNANGSVKLENHDLQSIINMFSLLK